MSNISPTRRSRAQIMLLSSAPGLFVVLWSTGFIGAKLGLPYAEPATFLAMRFALVSVILGVIALLAHAAWPKSWMETFHIMVVGLLVHGVYLGGVFAGIDLGVSAGDSALIVGMQPILTAIFIGPMLSERVEPRQWMGFVLGTIGVTLVSLRYLGAFDSSFEGVMLCVLAVVGMSLGTLYQKRFCAGMNLLSGSFLQFVAATLMMGAIAYGFESRIVQWSGEFIFALVWLVLILSLGAMTVLWVLIRAQAATQVASIFFMVTPVTALVPRPLFGETLNLKSLAGMALVVGGVLLVKSRERSDA
ncbi:MAG: DMT family transporter [Arenicellales bacterium]